MTVASGTLQIRSHYNLNKYTRLEEHSESAYLQQWLTNTTSAHTWPQRTFSHLSKLPCQNWWLCIKQYKCTIKQGKCSPCSHPLKWDICQFPSSKCITVTKWAYMSNVMRVAVPKVLCLTLRMLCSKSNWFVPNWQAVNPENLVQTPPKILHKLINGTSDCIIISIVKGSIIL